MLEANLTTLFNLEAAAEQPAARISLPVARRSARIRRYWHRALVVATPVMAAGAVVAIVTGTTLLASGPGARLGKTGPAAPRFAALGRGFDPMRLYASFGWLPAGTTAANGETSRTIEWIDTQGVLSLSLIIDRPGLCGLQQVSAGSAASELNCSDNSLTGGLPSRIIGRAPGIGGRPAYWASSNAGQFIVWTYSGRGWALLQYSASCSAPKMPLASEVTQLPGTGRPRCSRPAAMVNVARRARVGFPVGSLAFPAVLTRVPKDWQVATTSFTDQHGRLLADQVQVTAGPRAMSPNAGPPDNTPVLTIVPVSEEKATNTYCRAAAEHPRREVINGYHVLTGTDPLPHPPIDQACAPDADGLVVNVTQTGAHQKLSVTALFGRLHLLGIDPADWTTRPVR